jgi:hypothetical protein
MHRSDMSVPVSVRGDASANKHINQYPIHSENCGHIMCWPYLMVDSNSQDENQLLVNKRSCRKETGSGRGHLDMEMRPACCGKVSRDRRAR